MELAMISLKVLSAAAALALALSAAAPTDSLAQVPLHRGPGGAGGPGAGRAGGVPATRFAGAPVAGAPAAGAPAAGAAPRVYGGGGHFDFDRDHHHHHGNGFIPGAVAGALIGGAIAAQEPYYAGTPYYTGNPYYYGGDDDSDSPVQVAPDSGGDDVAYCMQTYRSYDPQSGTYLGFDGYRHPCP
jgi:hypothetical protein